MAIAEKETGETGEIVRSEAKSERANERTKEREK